MQHLVSLSLGLGNGAVFGALTLAIVLTFRSSGVLNFATGAIVLDIAYVYAFLRQGELLLLIPGLPDTVGSGEPVGPVPALVIALLMAVALGLVLYPLIFRPPGAVSALGVSLVLAGLVCQKLGTDQVTSNPIFPAALWRSGSPRVSSDQVYFALAILALAVSLALAFRYNRFGLPARAAAESERGLIHQRHIHVRRIGDVGDLSEPLQ